MTREDFLAAYNIGHRDGKEDVYCPNDYDDIFNIGQQSCENCCNGNQEEKAKLCQKSYIAGMEHNRENEGIIKVNKDGQPSEDEKVIRIKKGTLKVRTGKYVVYDVEWLKKHFDTTEAKIYGQSKAEGARGDIPLQQSVPKMPQPNERTETHECDYISRKLMHDMGATCIAARNEDGDLVALGALNILPSATPQPKTGQPKTGHWIEHKHGGIEHIECSKCRCWFLRKDLIRNSYCPNCGSYNGGDTNPQPSENLNVVLDELNRIGRNAFKDDTDYDNLFDFISNLPSVSSQPKTAHWEWTQYDSKPNFGNWHCSACRSIVVEHVPKTSVDGIPLYKYCPQCGAKMQEVQQ